MYTYRTTTSSSYGGAGAGTGGLSTARGLETGAAGAMTSMSTVTHEMRADDEVVDSSRATAIKLEQPEPEDHTSAGAGAAAADQSGSLQE
ncbi:unnamed protein product [Anisakis simplex]|uniref:Uncharacterized protein n=1 Tax=Anisakis simplex TaxID=6269 RepID=A0A0M3J171_ANISI|nr:unnamed protein product [Anisakis simplex]